MSERTRSEAGHKGFVRSHSWISDLLDKLREWLLPDEPALVPVPVRPRRPVSHHPPRRE